MNKKYWLLLGFVTLAPLAAFAEEDPVGSLLLKVTTWLDPLVAISIACALIFFVWNAISLIRSEDENKREEAKKGLWWGIIAMFVIVSIWGITRFIGKVIGAEATEAPVAFPQLPS